MKRSKQNPSSSEAEDTSRRRNRRQALALGGAAAAAAAVAALGMDGGKRGYAASGQALVIGQGNESNPGDWTSLVGSVTDGPIFSLRNDSEPAQEKVQAIALGAISREGVALIGTTFGSEGYGTRGLAYIGSPDTPPEEWVLGPGIGVGGMSGSGHGVLGQSESGTGVVGQAPGEAPAVLAVSSPLGPSEPDGGLALDVIGKAQFSTAGAGVVVPRRAEPSTVSDPAVTADSHVTVTFTGDPGGASVAWVERQPGTGFTVHLSGRSRSPIPFTYLIVEPGP